MSGAARALILDRDGVINEEVGYLVRPEDVRFTTGLHSLCRSAQRLGYKLVVVTNQSGIARGYYTEEDYQTLMAWMRAELAREGITLDAVYHSPDHPDYPEKRKRDEDWRKPGPGMLLAAARDLGLELAASVFVGDQCTDVAAGNAAGVRKMFLVSGGKTAECAGNYEPVAGLEEVEDWLEARK